ncbi:MAG: DUF1559 domain-containing protein [Planctomycetia bacterium]|nr:DUF1559 domain-containing protein [Planctomycetia bacterium]
MQAAREAARRMQCTNNLKQLAIATHNYHDTHFTLPPGGWNCPSAAENGDANGNGLSLHVAILPFMEQGSLYDKFDFRVGNPLNLVGTLSTGTSYTTNMNGVPTTVHVSDFVTGKAIWGMIKIDAFQCPSAVDDNRYAKWTNRFLWKTNPPYNLHYHGICGTYGAKSANTADGDYSTTAIGPENINLEGALPLGKSLSMASITDGTSNTLLFGEITGGTCKKRSSTQQTSWNGCLNGDNWVRGYICASVKMIGYGINVLGPMTTNQHYTYTPFNSEHSGGANFSLADGSVRFLSETMDVYLLKQLGNRQDGKVVSL